MHGIAGTYGSEDKALVRKMMGRIRHRGPDISRTHAGDRLALGACALAPRRRGRTQPLAEDGGLAVACDSYMFNRAQLKERFAPDLEDGFTDAQLLLRMYQSQGTRAFNYIDGAFAAAVVDGGKMVLARDRYGIKPLYLSGGMRAGSFSSEMKSQIVAKDDFVPFPPGKVMRQGKGLYPIRPARLHHEARGRKESPHRCLRRLLVESVSECSEGLPNLNVLLSGGIDSSAVAAAAAQVAPRLDTVCVGFPGGVDIDMARKVAENLGTSHKEGMYTVEEMLESLEDVIYASETFDFPLVRSCIPNFLATSMFRGPTRVTLCGEGGDEIFAGYDYMRDITDEAKLSSERRNLLRTGWKTGFQRVDRMNAYASLDGRMPLMEGRVIDLGLQLGWKDLGRSPNRCKLALRKAFEDVLPEEVMRRRKQRFSDGAGSMHALVKVSEQLISDKEFEKERRGLPRNRIRTKEELLYYRIFEKHFPSPSAAAAVGLTPRP